MVLMPGLKRNIFPSSVAAKKAVNPIIEQKGSSLDYRAFSFQLTRLDSMEYLDLTIAKKVEEQNLLFAQSREKNCVGSLH